MTVLSVESIHLHRGGRLVTAGMTFSADRGELVALMGASGSGKTTILRAIAALEPLSEGCINVNGLRIDATMPLTAAQRADLHRRVGFVFQFHHLFANMDALSNVALAPMRVLKQPRPQAMQRSLELLASLGVAERAAAFPHELSGGEAQRVAIARALATDPPLLLMDEPTASLDPARREGLATALKHLAAGGRTIVMATHDEEFVRSCGSRVITVR
jgi:polar amino acid transport system ATP-binding protein